MIHYHGGPITPATVALHVWRARHACVSFAWPDQVELAFEVCQSVMLDNGAFTAWKGGNVLDLDGYAAWVRHWCKHPGFDFALIPDVIDGSEHDNDLLFAFWREARLWDYGVPVWHLHESVERLARLCRQWPRVALGSSGEFADVGTPAWWQRMGTAMDAICDEQGRPPCRLHGLRMLNPTIFSQLPLASADSTNVARNIGIDAAWDRGPYTPKSKSMRAAIMADRIEHHAAAATWQRTFGHQENLELVG